MPLPVPKQPWEWVGIDFMGPFKTTRSGYNGVMVVVCLFSKMKHVIPVTMSISAPGVAKVFDREVVRLHGVPGVIVSDRDVRFTARFWRSWWAGRGVELAFSTAYHPQTDGQTERENRTVKEIMRTVVDERGEEWDEYLPMVEMALNSAKQASTGMSPFKMVYGREMTLPVDTRLKTRVAVDNPAVEALGDRLKGIWEKATEQIGRAKQRQEVNANRERREESFAVGDKVMLSTEEMKLVGTRELNRSVQFLPKYIGPFPIIRVKNRNAYELQLPPKFQMEPVVNITRLKRYVDGEEMFPDREKEDTRVGEELEDANGGGMEWEVEAILGERGTGERKQFLVKWKGYPLWECTWEPRKHLTHVDELLGEYREKLRLKEGERARAMEQMYGVSAKGERLMGIFKGVESVTELKESSHHGVSKFKIKLEEKQEEVRNYRV